MRSINLSRMSLRFVKYRKKRGMEHLEGRKKRRRSTIPSRAVCAALGAAGFSPVPLSDTATLAPPTGPLHQVRSTSPLLLRR